MFGPFLGVFFALGLVLLLLGVALRLLRRFMPGPVVGRHPLQTQVVHRLSLSPRQGIAFVRAGSRVVAVSVGEGGVRRLFELDEEEAAELLAAGAGARAQAGGNAGFHEVLLRAMRGARADVAPAPRRGRGTRGSGIVVAAILSAAALSPLFVAASAQGVQATQAATPPAVAPAATAPPPRIVPGAAASGVAAPTASPAAAPVNTAAEVVTRLAPQLDLRLGSQEPGAAAGGLRLSGTVGVVVMLGLLTLLPTLVLMMTSFTRILLVLHFVKQGIGAQTGLPNQLVAALALILTFFVMAPTLGEVNRQAITPWMDGRIDQARMLEVGARPFRAFMLRQTRPADVQAFVRMSGAKPPASPDDVPLVTLMAAFATSELRTAFAIGFAVMLPFLVIDVVVSSTLMSMGFAMLPPAMVSLPFKLLLFVLVDGWSLVMQSLVASFR